MKNVFEIIIGILVLFVAGMFTYFAYHTSGEKLNKDDQYTLIVNFDNADGIKIGSEVRVSGVVVGKVIYKELDYDTYSAVLKMTLDKKVKLPEDSSAQIVSSSLLGDKYISIIPGTEEKMLKDQDSIEFSQSSINIEGVISKFLFGLKEKNETVRNEDDNSSSNNDKSDEQDYIFNDHKTKNSIS